MIKPMKTVEELIQHMKNKGIKFNIINDKDAEEHLNSHNNFFQLILYRKNYVKYTSGLNKGKYENLEFAHLVELARLDVEIRSLLLNICLDIEHFLKVELLRAVEDRMVNNKDEDGYKILEGYLNADDIIEFDKKITASIKRKNQYNNKFSQNLNNPYCYGLISKYNKEMPIWAYVELCSFGDLIDLIEYYSKNMGWNLGIDKITLDRIRQIRNACAHGNCIINDLKPNRAKSSSFVSNPPKFLVDFLINAGIKQSSRQKKMSNPRISQIVHLLYVFDKIVVTKNTRFKRIVEIHNLINNRLQVNSSYFEKNQLLSTTYQFFKNICININ